MRILYKDTVPKRVEGKVTIIYETLSYLLNGSTVPIFDYLNLKTFKLEVEF